MKTKLFVSLFLLLSVYVFADYRADVQTPNGSNVVAYVTTESPAATRVYFDSHFANAYPNAEQMGTYAGYSSSRTFNCHGYAWYMSELSNPLSAPRWIGYSAGNIDEHVYWSDGSYIEVPQPVYPGKVSWASGDHSAVTTKTNGLYISKWNEYPLMRHQQGDSPYGSTNLKYYKRAGWPANDDYVQATTLTPNLSSLVSGTTRLATMSQQTAPSCNNHIEDDVWYKFVASSQSHTINVSDVQFFGDAFGIPAVGIAVYNANLGQLGCTVSNNNFTVSSLTSGQTYYVRLWTVSNNPKKAMDFKIGVSTTASNAITSISVQGLSSSSYQLSAVFTHDSSIPSADIGFEWQIVEPAPHEGDHYGFSLHAASAPHQIILQGTDGDTATRVRARMKRISTNTPISNWFTTTSLIWIN